MLRTRYRWLVVAACGVMLAGLACAGPRPTPTPLPQDESRQSPLLGRVATVMAAAPPAALPPGPAAPERAGAPPPRPTPTPMPGSVAPPSRRVRLLESVVPRSEPRPDAPQTAFGRAPARLVVGAREVWGDWVRIEVGSVSAWVPRSAVEFLP